jgi:hypothetical protein
LSVRVQDPLQAGQPSEKLLCDRARAIAESSLRALHEQEPALDLVGKVQRGVLKGGERLAAQVSLGHAGHAEVPREEGGAERIDNVAQAHAGGHPLRTR